MNASNNEKDFLEKLKAAESYEETTVALEKEESLRKEKKKKAMIISGGVLGGIVAVVLIFSLSVPGTVKNFLAPNELGSSQIVGGNNTVSGGAVRGDDVKENEAESVIEDRPEWAKISIEYAEDKNFLSKEIFNDFSYSALMGNTYGMPLAAHGYHTRGELDDYSVNYTLEDYVSIIGEYIERLINPTFGGWSEYQFSNANAAEDFDVELFNDVFSEEYKRINFDKKPGDYFPVYADWGSNDYGMNNLVNSSRWHGVIKNMESEIFGYGTPFEYTEVSIDIVFYAWSDAGEKLNKEGKLNLTIIPGNEYERPLVVDKASLSVG